MSEFKASSFTNEDGSHGPDFVGLTTFTSPYYFVPPSGTTAERPSGSDCVPGMLRFNTDIGRLEVWRGDHWGIILGESPNLGISTAAAPASSGTGARGVFGGGDNPSDQSRIDYITIPTLGNSIQFGDLTDARTCLSACSSSTRGLFCGGYNPTEGIIDFVTISSTGNAISFGNLTQHRIFTTSLSSSTRGITAGGRTSPSPALNQFNIIDYVTITSTGNSQDFGDLIQPRGTFSACSSSTRGLFGGGYVNPATPAVVNTIDYITISTLGNAIDFGDTISCIGRVSSCSSPIRGIFIGSESPGNKTNTIEFVTIASTGNAVDFGDLTAQRGASSACASPIRGLIIGGREAVRVNTIEYVTIASTGNAIDFGDSSLASPATAQGACSNAHGGL